MTSFYLLPYPVLVFGTVILTITAIVQTLCSAYGFFTFRYLRRNLWRSLWEISVLGELALQMLYLAEAIYQIRDGFYYPRPYIPARIALFLLTTALSLAVAVSERDFLPLSVPVVTAMTLPEAERLTGSAFPVVLFMAMVFWLFRAINHLLIYRRQRDEELSAFSVKEAVDTMDFGILYCRADGVSDGQILLANRKMQEIMFTLTGKRICSGKFFYEQLKSGDVAPGCRKEPHTTLPVYSLPDGSIWRFDLLYTRVRGIRCAILVASDTTEYMHTTQALYRQNEQLDQRNKELKIMLQNLESTCRTEEILRAKSRVHDLLGQQISLILRSVREHREPDEALLQAFAGGLPPELKSASADCRQSLLSVARSFRNLGIAVNISGDLPSDPELQKVFYEIATEAMTNAVHHGYATEISIAFSCTDGVQTLTVRDNGTVKDADITEGGGLRDMRRKVRELGGSFSYETTPHFSISIQIPQGGAL